MALIKEPNYSLLLVITFVWRSVRKKQTMLFLKLLLRNKSLPMFLVHSQTSSQVFYFLLWKVLYLFHSCFCPSEMVETDNLHFLCSVTSDVFASWWDIILGVIPSLIKTILPLPTEQKEKFSIEDFYSKCDQIRRKLRKTSFFCSIYSCFCPSEVVETNNLGYRTENQKWRSQI